MLYEFINWEPLYEDIKASPNDVWFIFEDKIKKFCKSKAYFKNFDVDELIQFAYIYFIEFCKRYDPYYDNKFFPFANSMFAYVIKKTEAYIQRYYFKQKREQPINLYKSDTNAYSDNDKVSDFENKVYNNSQHQVDSIKQYEDTQYCKYLLNLLNEREQKAIKLTLQGRNQTEAAKILNLSQPRFSAITNNALDKLYRAINDIFDKNVKRPRPVNAKGRKQSMRLK